MSAHERDKSAPSSKPSEDQGRVRDRDLDAARYKRSIDELNRARDKEIERALGGR